jgi:hypothetical protein
MEHIIAQNAENNTERINKLLLKRGDRVIVKDFAGKLLDRRVWGMAETVVYLCTDRLYEALLRGLERTPPIGFPKYDIQA